MKVSDTGPGRPERGEITKSGDTGPGRPERGEMTKPHGASPARAARRERERQRHKEEILAAAAEMFSRLSYEKASMKRIAERTGLSVGKIYNHFDSKEAIFQELVERNFKIIESNIQNVIEQVNIPLQKIRDIISIYIRHFEKHRDFMLIVQNENPIRMKGIIKKFHIEQKGLIAGLFGEAIEQGYILREDPYLLASVLLGSIRGLFTEFMDGERENYSDSINEIIDRMILKPLEIKRKSAS